LSPFFPNQVGHLLEVAPAQLHGLTYE
jgi:hypothetical protein